MRHHPTIRFTLTPYQNNQIKLLGRMLWPGEILARDELCRRIRLDSCDAMLVACIQPRSGMRACLSRNVCRLRGNDPHLTHQVATFE